MRLNISVRPLYVDCFICFVFQTSPQTTVTWYQIGLMRPQRTINYSVPENVAYGSHCNIGRADGCRVRLKQPVFLLITYVLNKGVQEFVQCTFLNWSIKRLSPLILVALTAHRIPTLLSRNSTSVISLRLSADQYLLFSAFAWVFYQNHASSVL